MENILVVEDNDDVRENTIELLAHYGYNTLAAQHGKEGYKIAVSALPDVIICDVTMPYTNGLGLLKLLKDNDITKHIPIIFFSAGSAPLEVKRGMQMGANEYVQKPFSDEDLLDAIRRCLKGRHPESGSKDHA